MLSATLGAFIALVLLAVLALTRQGSGGRPPPRDRASLEDPLRVVDEMLANGEIDLKDYQTRRAQLRKRERS